MEYIVIIVTILLIITFNLFTPYITGAEAPMAVVSGTSMLPLFHEGDIVLLYKPSPQDIHVGDVIVYKRCGGGYIIHRVIDVVVIGNRYYYVTKGDNNSFDDSRLGQFYEYNLYGVCSSARAPGIPYERVAGVAAEINGATFKIPYLGYLSFMLTHFFEGFR